MKTKLFTLLFAVAANIGTMFASVSIDGIDYNLNETELTAEVTYGEEYFGSVTIPDLVTYSGKSYSVTSIGSRAFSDCSGLTSVTIPNSVTSIGYEAFYNCTGLTSIEIPNSVTSIGYQAFSGCTGLTSVTIPESVTSIEWGAFSGCTGLTSIEIPNSVTSIGDWAFSSCNSLTSINVYNGNANYCSVEGVLFNKDNTVLVQYPGGKKGNYTIPNSVTSIGGWAFSSCNSLTSVTIPESVTSIEWGAFSGCTGLTSIEIPNSVTSIGDWAFYGCTGLTSVTIGNSVTSIGDEAFSGCENITSIVWNAKSCNSCNFGAQIESFVFGDSVEMIPASLCYGMYKITSITIPNSVTSIGGSAFSGCTGLTSVTIGNNVASIEFRTFEGCTGLTSIEIPNSVTSIGGWAFQNCTGLTSVTIPNSVTSIGYQAFSGCTGLTSSLYNAHVFAYLPTSYSGAYTIPDGIELIADAAFADCTGLTSVTIPNSVTSIGYQAFYGCSCLTSIDIPNSVTSIGRSAFSGCYQLATASIGNGVTKIEAYAFYGCSSLTTITMSSIIPPTMVDFWDDYEQFEGCYNLNAIYVPCGTINEYKTANRWELYESVIKYKPLPYAITTHATNGTIHVPQNVCDALELTAIPDSSYRFVQWSDGNIDNPRTIALTQDTSFTAEFIKQFKVNTNCDDSRGNIEGETGDFDYLTQLTYTAIPNYGYHFVRWSDGNSQNPRTITLTQDSSISAVFAKNVYTIIDNSNHTHGYIDGSGTSEYLDEIMLTPVNEYGYHFTQWSDGVTDNPRTIILTQDTTFTAEFAIDKSGTCGKDNALTWSYDDKAKELTISGNSTLDDNYTYGVEAPTQMRKLILSNDISVIGENAFNGSNRLIKIHLGNAIETIGNYAFKNCPYILEIHAPMEFPPIIDASVFEGCGDLSGINCYVQEESLPLYKKTNVWKDFNLHVEAGPTGIDPVTGNPSPVTQKILHNGQILILRGEKVYTVTGEEVR